ncbi:MAG: hypothetical protein ACRDL0_18980, partial [Thermoleophilaceae bacterium]
GVPVHALAGGGLASVDTPAGRGTDRPAPGTRSPAPGTSGSAPSGDTAPDRSGRAAPISSPSLTSPASPAAPRHRSSSSAAAVPDGQAGTAGIDLGLVLACVGLLAAAALLGLTEDGRKAGRRSRERLAGALRPLLGRR